MVVSASSSTAALKAGKTQILDVRPPDFFTGKKSDEARPGRIPGASLNALSVFDPAALPEAKPGQRIVLHCRSGKRSITALGLAQDSGRMDIRAHFTGGMLEWVGAGEQVLTG